MFDHQALWFIFSLNDILSMFLGAGTGGSWLWLWSHSSFFGVYGCWQGSICPRGAFFREEVWFFCSCWMMAENFASSDGRPVRGLAPLQFSFSWLVVGWTNGTLSEGGGGALLFFLVLVVGLVIDWMLSLPGDRIVFWTTIGRDPSNSAAQWGGSLSSSWPMRKRPSVSSILLCIMSVKLSNFPGEPMPGKANKWIIKQAVETKYKEVANQYKSFLHHSSLCVDSKFITHSNHDKQNLPASSETVGVSVVIKPQFPWACCMRVATDLI